MNKLVLFLMFGLLVAAVIASPAKREDEDGQSQNGDESSDNGSGNENEDSNLSESAFLANQPQNGHDDARLKNARWRFQNPETQSAQDFGQ